MATMTTSQLGFNAESFAEMQSQRANQPDWLRDMRAEAWRTADELPMPNGTMEEWMRTDIRLFRLSQFSLPTASDEGMPPSLLDVGVELGGQLTSLNSHVVSHHLDDELASQGVLFGSLESLVQTHGDQLRPYFKRQLVQSNYDKFAALHAAFWTGGAVLFVPKNVRLETPLHVFSALAEGGVDLGRLLVILEDGAEATLLTETANTSASGAGLHCGSLELFVGNDAHLRFINLQNWNNRVWHFAHQKGVVGRNGQMQWTIGALGSRLAKVNQHVALAGSDANAQVNGVMFTEGRQHLSYHTLQHHEAPHCHSDLLYKAALQEEARTVWRGMIKVDEEAQRTDAYQRNDSLMLSRTARADSIPGLEIEADDVRCTHGSTAGRVDNEQIFYACSRGYNRSEAVKMIVTGFFQQVFDRITIESVRNALGEAIRRRVRDIEE